VDANIDHAALGTAGHTTAQGGPVLGRYTPSVVTGEALHTVHLERLPIPLFLRAREHHDDLVRELTLMAIRQAEDPDPPELPPRLREIVETLGRRFAGRASRIDPARDAAIERGALIVDVTYEVPASVADEMNMLADLIDAADEFSRAEKLLTLPRDTAVVAFARWYTDEFVRQINGAPPTPWDGPLT
jgi:hypothetical protein